MTDYSDILPHDSDAYDPSAPEKPRPAVLGGGFAYVGQGLTVPQFEAYLEGYDFGPIPPDYIVLHHTANPDASYAPLSPDPRIKWDRSEAGASQEQIKAKRKAQLDGLKRYYEHTLGWTAGPHLFIDEKWIWLMTPLSDVGIHAKWGNSFRAFGKLHYSVGIEVIGNYDHVLWSASVAANVRGAVLALQRRLRTFELRYLYPTPSSKPGMTADGQRPRYPERLRYGGIASHRDFNKPFCPGAAITETYYMGVLIGQPQTPNTQHPTPNTYVVKDNVTLGATIRSAPRRNAAVLGKLTAGEAWEGEERQGELISDKDFGTSDVWIVDGRGRAVWSGLLEKE